MPIRLHPSSPNLNVYMERFSRSLKSECLDRMIFFGENSLRHAVHEYLALYHRERNHQGLEIKVIDPVEVVGQVAGKIECRAQLGGMLRYYSRDAAKRMRESKQQSMPCNRYAPAVSDTARTCLIRTIHGRITSHLS